MIVVTILLFVKIFSILGALAMEINAKLKNFNHVNFDKNIPYHRTKMIEQFVDIVQLHAKSKELVLTLAYKNAFNCSELINLNTRSLFMVLSLNELFCHDSLNNFRFIMQFLGSFSPLLTVYFGFLTVILCTTLLGLNAVWLDFELYT